MLSGYELYTDIDLDTADAIPRDCACDVRENVLSKMYTFVVLFGTVWGSVHLPCHGDVSQDDLWSMFKEMEDVVINLSLPHVEWDHDACGTHKNSNKGGPPQLDYMLVSEHVHGEGCVVREAII